MDKTGKIKKYFDIILMLYQNIYNLINIEENIDKKILF